MRHMKLCWRNAGLTEAGAKVADALIGRFVDLVKMCPPEDGGRSMARILVDEANFRVNTLPSRTKAFQREYAKANYTRSKS
jgi:hypothetical protein